MSGRTNKEKERLMQRPLLAGWNRFLPSYPAPATVPNDAITHH